MILLGDLTIGIGRMRIRNKFVRATTKSFVGNKMTYFAHNMRLGESLQHAGGGVILAKKFCSGSPPVVSEGQGTPPLTATRPTLAASLIRAFLNKNSYVYG